MSFDSGSSAERRSSEGSASDCDATLFKPVCFEDELQSRIHTLVCTCRSWKKRYVSLKSYADQLSASLRSLQSTHRKTVVAMNMTFTAKLKQLEEELVRVTEQKAELFREKTSLETSFKKTLEQHHAAVEKLISAVALKDEYNNVLRQQLEEQKRITDQLKTKLAKQKNEMDVITATNQQLENTISASKQSSKEEKLCKSKFSDDLPYKVLYELASCKLKTYEEKYEKLPAANSKPDCEKSSHDCDQRGRCSLIEEAVSLDDSQKHNHGSPIFSSLSADSSPARRATTCNSKSRSSASTSSSSSATSPSESPLLLTDWRTRNQLIARMLAKPATDSQDRERERMPLIRAQTDPDCDIMDDIFSPFNAFNASNRRLSLSHPELTNIAHLTVGADDGEATHSDRDFDSEPVCESPSPVSSDKDLGPFHTTTPSPDSSPRLGSVQSRFDKLRNRRNGIATGTDVHVSQFKLRRSRSKDFMDIFRKFNFSKDHRLSPADNEQVPTNKGKSSVFQKLSRSRKASSTKI